MQKLRKAGLLQGKDETRALEIITVFHEKFRDPLLFANGVVDGHSLHVDGWLKLLGIERREKRKASFPGEDRLIKLAEELNGLVKAEQQKQFTQIAGSKNYEEFKGAVMKALETNELEAKDLFEAAFTAGIRASSVREKGAKALNEWLRLHPFGLKLALQMKTR